MSGCTDGCMVEYGRMDKTCHDAFFNKNTCKYTKTHKNKGTSFEELVAVLSLRREEKMVEKEAGPIWSEKVVSWFPTPRLRTYPGEECQRTAVWRGIGPPILADPGGPSLHPHLHNFRIVDYALRPSSLHSTQPPVYISSSRSGSARTQEVPAELSKKVPKM